jgi:Tfp pilus assembly protein PilW
VRQRGHTVFEMLIGSVIAMLIGTGLFQLMRASYANEQNINSANNAATNVRAPIDILADHLRSAQQVESDNYAVIKEGHLSDISYYTDNAGSFVRYRLNGTNLERTDGGNTTIAVRSVTSLTFTYYTSQVYNDTSGITATTDSHEPTTAERPKIAVIDIYAAVNVGGVVRTITTRVRLRNSPRKNSL